MSLEDGTVHFPQLLIRVADVPHVIEEDGNMGEVKPGGRSVDVAVAVTTPPGPGHTIFEYASIRKCLPCPALMSQEEGGGNHPIHEQANPPLTRACSEGGGVIHRGERQLRKGNQEHERLPKQPSMPWLALAVRRGGVSKSRSVGIASPGVQPFELDFHPSWSVYSKHKWKSIQLALGAREGGQRGERETVASPECLKYL
ncbi:hypothetical protein CPB84DRAFT_1749458 [Gymnopilus junonius]|uniref:Uncharacterized protein n=1 Tax=Gymnopilus junonius TaxID=109634 RepID=A0A9P5NG30_GYMJU|nr:hypothetical protein CPB84DRAFT_1749458 [Gymnopilus junonius]